MEGESQPYHRAGAGAKSDMSTNEVIIKTELALPLFIRGKARDTYDLGKWLLIVTTDRISAFDSVLPCGIPQKGCVLNQISAFWFEKTKEIIPNHLVETIYDTSHLDNYLPAANRSDYPSYLGGRCMVVKKANRLPLECVVRGYLSGSAWADYRESGSVNGIALPAGLKESEELPEPIFTPTHKAESGHDLPISMAEIVEMVGEATASEIKEKSLAIYNLARKYALNKNIIIADTKMEFGTDENGKLILIDELLTPDSSRFWDTALYKVGQSQPSYDKQPVRDWLTEIGWNKEPPAPMLSDEVIKATTEKYVTAFRRLTNGELK